jgi:hypothetical protein
MEQNNIASILFLSADAAPQLFAQRTDCSTKMPDVYLYRSLLVSLDVSVSLFTA